jgi:hypothetical protein
MRIKIREKGKGKREKGKGKREKDYYQKQFPGAPAYLKAVSG